MIVMLGLYLAGGGVVLYAWGLLDAHAEHRRREEMQRRRRAERVAALRKRYRAFRGRP